MPDGNLKRLEEEQLLTRSRRLGGVSGIVFAVSLVAGFTLFGPKGGRYSADEINTFLAQPASSLVISIVLFVISAAALVAFVDYLSETALGAGRGGRAISASSLVAAASFLIGWGLYLAPPSSIGSGGPALDPGTSYAFVSAGMLVLFGVGGAALGVALLVLATGSRAMPAWVRAVHGLAGISALVSWTFLVGFGWSPNQWLPGPFYLVILWGMVIGIWLLASTSASDRATGGRPRSHRASGGDATPR